VYTLSLTRTFTARHYLIGGDWGDENRPHAHPYRLDLRLEGSSLDEHGYLVDLVEVEGRLDEQVEWARDRTLNDLPEFKGLNPSLEHFARIFAGRLAGSLPSDRLTALEVRLWESDSAWAGCRVELP
jgi:6-pyruvoyltetrahydropterin/6-carboxytetrahydropterin synthase